MATVTPVVLSTEAANVKYRSLVSEIGDVEEFKDRAAAYLLNAKDRALYDDLMELEYLLGI